MSRWYILIYLYTYTYILTYILIYFLYTYLYTYILILYLYTYKYISSYILTLGIVTSYYCSNSNSDMKMSNHNLLCTLIDVIPISCPLMLPLYLHRSPPLWLHFLLEPSAKAPLPDLACLRQLPWRLLKFTVFIHTSGQLKFAPWNHIAEIFLPLKTDFNFLYVCNTNQLWQPYLLGYLSGCLNQSF